MEVTECYRRAVCPSLSQPVGGGQRGGAMIDQPNLVNCLSQPQGHRQESRMIAPPTSCIQAVTLVSALTCYYKSVSAELQVASSAFRVACRRSGHVTFLDQANREQI